MKMHSVNCYQQLVQCNIPPPKHDTKRWLQSTVIFYDRIHDIMHRWILFLIFFVGVFTWPWLEEDGLFVHGRTQHQLAFSWDVAGRACNISRACVSTTAERRVGFQSIFNETRRWERTRASTPGFIENGLEADAPRRSAVVDTHGNSLGVPSWL